MLTSTPSSPPWKKTIKGGPQTPLLFSPILRFRFFCRDVYPSLPRGRFHRSAPGASTEGGSQPSPRCTVRHSADSPFFPLSRYRFPRATFGFAPSPPRFRFPRPLFSCYRFPCSASGSPTEGPPRFPLHCAAHQGRTTSSFSSRTCYRVTRSTLRLPLP